MKPLALDVAQFGDDESNTSNIKSSLQRGLPELTPAICHNDGTFVIVGSGPSMPQFVEDIRKERELGRPIVAVNGAHDFLCDNGIEPDIFLTVDPRQMPQNFKKTNDKTIYLLASRCHPDTFNEVKDKKVILWHSWSFEREVEILRGKLCIGGGTTSGLRAINVGYVLGFRKFVLYGLDSCLAGDKLTKRFSGEKAGQVVDVIVGDRTFYCNLAMAQQAQDFQFIYKTMPDITIRSKGNGLITAIIEERLKKGLHA